MTERYLVWSMDCKLRLKDGALIQVALEQPLDIHETEEQAEESARVRWLNGDDELLLVIGLHPFEAPKVLSLVGEVSGKMALDGYDLRWSIEANIEAMKQAILRDYTFVRRQEEVV